MPSQPAPNKKPPLLTAIVQARVRSTRLPEKVFLDLAGAPLIERVCERAGRAQSVGRVILATTQSSADDRLVVWAQQKGMDCFRGDEQDVLGRFYGCAQQFGAQSILRVTADDPFKDPDVIDATAELFFEQHLDFAHNNKPPTFPEGLDVEIFSFAALEKAHREARDPFEREHVTQYFFRNPQIFVQKNLAHTENLSPLRWTIDTEEDYRMAREVYGRLQADRPAFGLSDILDLIRREPQIARMNQDVPRSAMYRS